jgi:hypothetical protein
MKSYRPLVGSCFVGHAHELVVEAAGCWLGESIASAERAAFDAHPPAAR